jgi:hypothetical protein
VARLPTDRVRSRSYRRGGGWLVATATFAAALVLGACASPGPAKVSGEGFEQVDSNWRGGLEVRPGVDWGRYSKIRLERAPVEFRRNWARDQRRQGTTASRQGIDQEMERISSELSELLDEVFREELARSGHYSLTGEDGADVLRIAPRIEDLDVYAPDRTRVYIGYSLTDSSGSMTLLLNLSDSLSGQALARAVDNREDPRKGYYEWTTSAQNRTAARHMLQRWAIRLREWLDSQQVEPDV